MVKEKSKEDLVATKDIFKFILLIYIMGGLIGYIYELIYFLFEEKALINRGFLYGPFLPVYAWGAVLMLFAYKFKKHPTVVFISTALMAGILEYFTGYFMYLIWHQRWWDYSSSFLNINGFVCLKSFLFFGLGGLLLVYVVIPFVSKILKEVNPKIINMIFVIFFALFLFDNILSFTIRY